MGREAIVEKDGRVCLRVRVQPKASRDEVRCDPSGRIRIALTAPPVEGEANKALKAFLAKKLGLPKRAIAITGGEKSREKRLTIEGVTEEHVRESLRAS